MPYLSRDPSVFDAVFKSHLGKPVLGLYIGMPSHRSVSIDFFPAKLHINYVPGFFTGLEKGVSVHEERSGNPEFEKLHMSFAPHEVDQQLLDKLVAELRDAPLRRVESFRNGEDALSLYFTNILTEREEYISFNFKRNGMFSAIYDGEKRIEFHRM